MSGDRFSNNYMKHKRGQILLITVMLLATVMTVLLSITFQSTIDTQVTKLEEDSQKALAAAEAAIEVSLQSGSAATFGSSHQLASFSTNFYGGATISSATSNTFTSPLVAKDGAYTFYLGNYDLVTKIVGNNSFPGDNVSVCFNSATPNPAIEITLIRTATIKKYVIDPDSRIASALSSSGSCGSFQYSYTIPNGDFGADSKLLLVRVLYSSSKLYFSRNNIFPLQGKTITSEATSTTGVSKKVVLFQSYPQIPAEFFTTTF